MKMNSELLKLLSDFEVEEEYIANFEREKIRKVSTLRLLTKETFEKLFPEEGPRLEFKAQLDEYLNRSVIVNNAVISETTPVISESTPVVFETVEQAADGNIVVLSPLAQTSNGSALKRTQIEIQNTNPSNSTLQTADDQSTPKRARLDDASGTSRGQAKQQEARTDENDTVLSWCKSDIEGKIALAYYEIHGSLDDDHRSKVAKLCVNHFIQGNNTRLLDSTSEKNICDQILKIFPTEKEEVWMGDANVSRELSGGRGRLVTTWYAVRRKMKKVHMLNKKPPTELDNDEVPTDEVSTDAFLWVQNNKHPWNELLEKWKITTRLRRSLLMRDRMTVHQYMDKFPGFKEGEGGYALFNADFDVLFPGADMKLFSEWPCLATFILNKLSVKDKEEINDSFTPAVVKSKKVQWRPSRQESKEALFEFVKTKGDIQTAMNVRRERYEKYGLSLGPQALLIGKDADSVTASYVLVNRVVYSVENPLKAIDTVFKAMHALDTPYPAECKREWLFLQVAVYGINTPHDKKALDVTTKNLINEYSKFKEQSD